MATPHKNLSRAIVNQLQTSQWKIQRDFGIQVLLQRNQNVCIVIYQGEDAPVIATSHNYETPPMSSLNAAKSEFIEPTTVSNVSLQISVESGAYSILKLNSNTAKYESYADCDSLEVFLQKINHEIDLDFAS